MRDGINTRNRTSNNFHNDLIVCASIIYVESSQFGPRNSTKHGGNGGGFYYVYNKCLEGRGVCVKVGGDY